MAYIDIAIEAQNQAGVRNADWIKPLFELPSTTLNALVKTVEMRIAKDQMASLNAHMARDIGLNR